MRLVRYGIKIASLTFLYLSPISLCCSSRITASANTSLKNPCDEVRMVAEGITMFSKTQVFDDAISAIKNAAADKKEHIVSFGKDVDGSIIRSAASTGTGNNVSIPVVYNRFADIHNHTNERPPSSGDLYGFIDQAITDTNYMRYVVTPSGLSYAVILIDKKAALKFNVNYPRSYGITINNPDGTTTVYQPTFPQQLIDKFDQIKGWSGATDEMAMAFILKEYTTGVALLKRDSNGNFKRLNTIETIDDKGGKIYFTENCP